MGFKEYFYQVFIENNQNMDNLIDTHKLLKYREIDIDPKMEKPFLDELKNNMKGSIDPLTFTYDPKTGTGLLTDGNHRLYVANELGIKKLPVRLNRQYSKYFTYPNSKMKQIAPPGTEIKSIKELDALL